MPRLRDFAKLVRTKNAGPFWLTLDIMFPDKDTFDHVVGTGVITPQLISDFFKVDLKDVRLFNYAPANAIKVTIPRLVPSGDPADTDLFGGQQFGPLVDIEIPAKPNL